MTLNRWNSKITREVLEICKDAIGGDLVETTAVPRFLQENLRGSLRAHLVTI